MTSPISNLSIIGCLELLRDRFQEIWIPDAVRVELDHLPSAQAHSDIRRALDDGWLKVCSLPERRAPRILQLRLGLGEVEAILLALESNAELLLIDERAGLRVTGLLGVLLEAKPCGKIPSMKAALYDVRTEARFFLTPRLEARILEIAGE